MGTFDEDFKKMFGGDPWTEEPLGGEEPPREEYAEITQEVIAYPVDWVRDSFRHGSKEYELASELFKYCHQLLWDDFPSTRDERSRQRTKIQRKVDDAVYADELLARADQWGRAAVRILKQADKCQTIGDDLRLQIEQTGGPLPYTIEKRREKARQRMARKSALKTYGSPKIKGVAASAASPADLKTVPKAKLRSQEFSYQGHPNDIYRLKPSAQWELYVDESGQDEDFETGKGGVIAGVLSDLSDPLPPQPALHSATDETPEKIAAGDALLETLTHHPNAGVLAVPVRAYQSVSGWGSAISSLIDLVLRLLPLPVDGGKTKLVVYIEGRKPYSTAENFVFLRDACLFLLAQTFPERAERIDLDVRAMDKFHSHNAYPDLVANTCFAKGDFQRERLKLTGWQRTCYLNFQAGEIGAALDCFHRGEALTDSLWSHLLVEANGRTNHSIVDALLVKFGEEVRTDVKKWRTYLDLVLAHLDSKAIQMRVLQPQIAWLKEYEPAGVSLPPRLRLLWLTAQLATENHAGGVSFGAGEHAAEFRDLGARLKDEDAPLVCFAALHLAVEKTDGFEFDSAREFLASWENEPVAVPGLRYHAQVLSSLGQHAAFTGDNVRALDYFNRAKTEFSRLSDEWQRDYDQTNAYAVIAAMDAGSPDLDRLMAEYLYGGAPDQDTMVDMACQFAGVGGDEPDSKYAHAIFLRHLVTLPGDHPVRQAYLARRDKWQWCEDGHPWELIAFYRALLLGDSPEACDWLRRGVALCEDAGPTLQVIACVLLGTLLGWKAIDRDVYSAKVEEVVVLLPALGAERIAALREQAESPRHGLDLARAVLPFNFR